MLTEKKSEEFSHIKTDFKFHLYNFRQWFFKISSFFSLFCAWHLGTVKVTYILLNYCMVHNFIQHIVKCYQTTFLLSHKLKCFISWPYSWFISALHAECHKHLNQWPIQFACLGTIIIICKDFQKENWCKSQCIEQVTSTESHVLERYLTYHSEICISQV